MLSATVEAIEAIGAVVVAFDVHDVVGGVVIHIVAVEHPPKTTRILEIPVSCEVDNAHSAGAGIVGGVVFVAVEQSVGGARLCAFAQIVVMLGDAKSLVVERSRVGGFINLDTLPIGRVAVPLTTKRVVALPSVEIRRERRLLTVSDIAEASANLGKHEEWSLIDALGLVLLAKFCESGNKSAVECESRDVTAGIDSETVNSHFDKLAVALD